MTPAPISSTSDSATSQTISSAPRADADGAVAPPAFLQRVVEIGAAGAKRRQRAGEDAGQDRRAERRTSRTRASMEISSARGTWSASSARRGAQARARQQQPDGAAGSREHQRLDQQLLEDAARVRRRAPRGSRAPCAGRARARTAGCRRWRRRSAARARPRRAASRATSGCRRRSAPAAAPPSRPSRRWPADTPARAASRSASISDCACATLDAGLQPRDHLSRCGCRGPRARVSV